MIYDLAFFWAWSPRMWKLRWRRPTKQERRGWSAVGFAVVREVYLGPALLVLFERVDSEVPE
jgi:hypothetical protein